MVTQTLTKEKVKEMVTNLPSDIKSFKVLTTLRNKNIENSKIKTTVLVTFKDNSKKEFDIPIKYYKEKFIAPTINIEETTSILEGKNLDLDVKRTYNEEEKIDEDNLTKYVHEKHNYYKYNYLPIGLRYTSNKISGVIDYKFRGEEEEKVFDVEYYSFDYTSIQKDFEITLLRDTDRDGIPDKDDDDKDGDGFTNDEETANGSDPYNKNIKPGMTKKQILDVLVNDLEKLINDSKNNSFENKNKIDVDTFKKENLSTVIEKLEEVKNSYNDTTSDVELEKLQKQVEDLIYNIKDSLNNIQDKANFEVLDKEVSNLLIKKDYDEEAYKTYIKYIEEAKNLNRDTATQTEVNNMVVDIVNVKSSVMYDGTKAKIKEKIKELKEQLDNGQCQEEECSYIKDKILYLYSEEDHCDSVSIEELIETVEISKDLFKKTSLKNPKTGIKTYGLIILFIIFISYKLIKKKKSYIR